MASDILTSKLFVTVSQGSEPTPFKRLLFVIVIGGQQTFNM